MWATLWHRPRETGGRASSFPLSLALDVQWRVESSGRMCAAQPRRVGRRQFERDPNGSGDLWRGHRQSCCLCHTPSRWRRDETMQPLIYLFFFIVNVLSVSIEATFIEKVITAFEERLLSTSNRVNSLEKGNSAAMLLSQMSPDAAKINFERMARARYYTGCCLRIRTRKTSIIYVYILSGNIRTMYAHECFLDSVYALSLTNV